VFGLPTDRRALKGMVQYDIVMGRTRIASTSVWLSQWGPLLTTGKLAWGYTPECPSLTTFSWQRNPWNFTAGTQ